MEKNKDRQLTPSTSAPQLELNPIIDEDQGQQDEKSQHQEDVELSGKKPRIDSPSNDNGPSENHQNPHNLQWSYALQPANEHQVPNISPSPINTCQWQPQIQLSGGLHQVQQLQLPPHLISSNLPAVVMPQRPSYQLQGAHNLGSCQPFPQMGSSENTSGQVPAGNGLVSTARNSGQVPSVLYQFGYPHATYPAGPWDPSSWWGQMQSPPFCVYPFPGACNLVPPPAPQPITNCSAASGQSSQKGVIRPPVKISQKHQLLWEAQSAENVQLWSVIASLQGDLAELRRRLVKVETDAKPLQTSGEQLPTHGTGNNLMGQTTKRGRPRKFASPVADTLPSPDEPHPRPRSRRPALSKAPPEIKEINFQKDDKNKVDFIETVSPLTSTSQHANGEKFASIFTDRSSPVERSSVGPAYQNPNSQIQRRMILHNPSTETKAVDNKSQEQVKKLIGETSSTNQGIISDGNQGCPSHVPSGECQRYMRSAISQRFYSQGNGGVVYWGMNNENDNASEDLDEATAESDKEEDEEKEKVEGIRQAKNGDLYGAITPEDGNLPDW